MSGFGSGNFSNGPFGSSNWARKVLFDVLPEVYRRMDTTNSDFLSKWSDGIGLEYRKFKSKIDNFSGIRIPDEVSTKYSDVFSIQLGQVITPLGELLSDGSDGSVDNLGMFYSPTARFSKDDVGNTITLNSINTTSPNNVNNRSQITTVIDANTAVLEPLPNEDDSVQWSMTLPMTSTGNTQIEVFSGDISGVVPGATLWDGSAQFTVVDRDLFLDFKTGKTLTDREGSDGVIDVVVGPPGHSLGLYSPTASFGFQDVGKILSVPGSPTLANSQQYRIVTTFSVATGARAGQTVAVIDPIDPAFGYTPVADPINTGLYWALLKRPTITISGTSLPTGIMTKIGFFGSATSGSPINEITNTGVYTFEQSDISSVLFAYLTDTYVVSEPQSRYIQHATISTVPSSYAAMLGSGISYTNAHSSTIGFYLTDTATPSATVYNPSLIQFLAQDLGVSFAQEESDARQRALLKNVALWASKKGTTEAYRILGSLTGWDVSAKQLFRLDFTRWGGAAYMDAVSGLIQVSSGTSITSFPLASPLGGGEIGSSVASVGQDFFAMSFPFAFEATSPNPIASPIEDRILGAGTSGTHGRLSYANGWLTFTDLSAVLDVSMVGTNITITGASSSAINKIYTIRSVPTPTTALLAVEDYIPPTTALVTGGEMILPDSNDGALAWRVSRYYSVVPPIFGSADDVVWDVWQGQSDDVPFFNTPDTMSQSLPFSLVPNIAVNTTLVTQKGRRNWQLTVQDTQVLIGQLYSRFAVGETVTQTGTGGVGTVLAEEDFATYSLLWVKPVSGSFTSTGSITIHLGGGSVGAYIEGTLVTVPWTTDVAAAALLAFEINNNLLTNTLVTAANTGNVVYLTPLVPGIAGDVTLVASGTGVTVSGSTMIGSGPVALTGSISGLMNGNYIATQTLGSIAQPGCFELVADADGTAIWLDALPTWQTAGQYTILTTSSTPPPTGLYQLTYNPPIFPATGITPASVVYLTINNIDQELDTDPHSPTGFINRLIEATPLHVRLIINNVTP